MTRDYQALDVTFRRDGLRLRGAVSYDPIRGRCACGAESGPLPGSSALRAWFVDHEHAS